MDKGEAGLAVVAQERFRETGTDLQFFMVRRGVAKRSGSAASGCGYPALSKIDWLGARSSGTVGKHGDGGLTLSPNATRRGTYATSVERCGATSRSSANFVSLLRHLIEASRLRSTGSVMAKRRTDHSLHAERRPKPDDPFEWFSTILGVGNVINCVPGIK